MPTTIANLAVKLTTDAAQMIGGFGKGLNAAKQFATGIGGAGAKVTAILGSLGTAATGGGLALLVHSQMEAIDQMAKLSDRTGISTESLAGLEHAADLSGVSTDQLVGGLEKMLKTLGEAATQGGESAKALQRLGITASDVASLAPDQMFTKLAESLNAITSPSERAAATVAIFGKAGQSLGPLLASGAEGIAAAEEEAKKLGLTFSRVDAAKVEAANDAMTRLERVATGVGRSLAIGIAPFIDAIATKLVGVATTGEGTGARVTDAFEWVVKSVAAAADYLELLKAGFKAMQAGATVAVLGAVWAFDKLAQGVGYVLNLLGQNVNTDGLDQMVEGLKDDVGKLDDERAEAFQAFMDGRNSKAATNAFKDIRAAAQTSAQAVADHAAAANQAKQKAGEWGDALQKAADNAKKVGDTIDDLTKQVRQLGMSDVDKKIDDAAAAGASPEQLAKIKAMLDQIKQFDDAKKSAEKLTDALADLDKQAEQAGMSDIDKKLDDLKRLGASPDQLARAQQELENSSSASASNKIVEPKLVMANSAEAQRLRYEAMNTPGVQKFNAQKNQQKQLDAAEKSVDLQQQIADAVKNPPIKQVTF